MLESLERSYLALLRAVILVVATITLIVALGSVTFAAISYVRSKGLTESQVVSGGSLAEYIASQKALPEAQADAEEALPTEAFFALPDVRTAAANLKSYLGNRSTISESDIAHTIQKAADEFGNHGDQYAGSVKQLTGELKGSTGKPLSERRILSLLEWHQMNFRAEIQRRENDALEASASSWRAATLAGSAFVAFVLTVFVFIFVKIERNLRTTRVVSNEVAVTEFDGEE